MSQLKQAYLLKNGEVRIQFVGDPPTKCSEATLLLSPNLEKFKAFPNTVYNEDQIAAISEALQEAANLPAEQKPKIEMYGKYDGFYELPRIFTRVVFPKEFVNKLKNVLAEAKISISGTFKLIHERFILPPSASPPSISSRMTASYVQIVPLDVGPDGRPRQRAQRAIPLPPPPPPAAPPRQTIWAPVDNQNEVFSVEGIQLKEQATYETFNGIGKMSEYYKSRGFKHAQLNFSIIIEWQDFAMDAEENERGVLAKLLQNKPMVDCTIVVSKTKEFQCHRCILAVHSDVLLANLESGLEESKTHRIMINDVRPEAVELMLEFMYCKKLELGSQSGEVILDLLKAAHKYNVGQLEKLTTQFLSRQPNDWFTMNGALGLYFFTANVDSLQNLNKKLRSIMRGNSQQLSSCSTYKEWMNRSPSTAGQFALMLLEPEPEPENLQQKENAGGNGRVEIVID